MGNIKLISDYEDFYDSLCDDESKIVYKRNLKDCMQRGQALNFLRSKSIKTIEIKPVSKFNTLDDKIVVYKNPSEHHSKGKEIMDLYMAKSMYGNCLASKYIEPDDLMTIKYLQIGHRRFRITFKVEKLSLDKGNIVNVVELSPEYNDNFRNPIFSIDYISVNNSMVATDFNEVENLQLLDFSRYITAESVIDEIKQTLSI